MNSWTLPVAIAVAICFALLNTAGYSSCLHSSAPKPGSIFGWPNTFLRTKLTQSQWDQVRVDRKCACGKPITTRELPLDQSELALIDRSAVLWNIAYGGMVVCYFALITELVQRKCKFLGPLTVRSLLVITTVTAVFARLSRSGYVYLNVLIYLLYSPLVKQAVLYLAIAIVVYLIVKAPSSSSEIKQAGQV